MDKPQMLKIQDLPMIGFRATAEMIKRFKKKVLDKDTTMQEVLFEFVKSYIKSK